MTNNLSSKGKTGKDKLDATIKNKSFWDFEAKNIDG